MAGCVLGELDFLLENLKQLLNFENRLICNKQFCSDERNQIQSLYDELQLLRTELYDSEESLFEHEEGKWLRRKMEDVISEAEDKVDSFVLNAARNGGELTEDFAFGFPLWLGDVSKEIRSIKEDVMAMKIHSIGVVRQPQPEIAAAGPSVPYSPVTEASDVIVGFEKDELYMADRLTGDQKQLDIISIVGMAGLGKTTLVRKVYNNSLIAYHFPIRAWVTVSQVYQKRNLLLGILNSFVSLTVVDQIQGMNEQQLCDKLFKILKCYKYLIVMDDIWDAKVWNDFRALFPNDNNGSRVILTSRNKNVVLEAMPGTHPYLMELRTEKESWALLERKVFGEERCPPGLGRIGRLIAKKCQGLPLAIVVIAGVLCKRAATKYEWMKVAESVSSLIVEDPKMIMNTVALSYTHLPYHLKPCFLYLAGFPEDYEVRVHKLIWLWMAEGFIRPKGGKSLEDIAEGCLTDLINRNLVIVAQRRYNGGIKTCCIHDLLREFCLTEAKEYRFMQQIYSDEQVYPKNINRRLFIHSQFFDYILWSSSFLHIRSLLCFPVKNSLLFEMENLSFISPEFKLIRVLDLKAISMYLFPFEVEQLVHLRYLAVWASVECLPSSISSLRNLETLIFKGIPTRSILLPYNIWKMTELRHICIEGEAYIPYGIETDNGDPLLLCNLQTISTLHLSSSNEEVLSRIPNVRKLGCIFSESGGCAFPSLDSLVELEALKLYAMTTSSPITFPLSYKFPSNLKKLSLAGSSLPWTEMSIVGKLPHLEVLKLLKNAFKGPRWNTSSGEFLQLKFLKFQGLDIEQWNASSDQFPLLQHLELLECPKLEQIPYDFADSCTLEMIKLDRSSPSAVESAVAIKKEKMSLEDYMLKISIQDRLRLLLPEFSSSYLSSVPLNPLSCPLFDSLSPTKSWKIPLKAKGPRRKGGLTILFQTL